MQWAWLARVIDAVPIEYPIGGVAVLLHLNHNSARTDGVKSARGEKHGMPFLYRNGVDTFGNGSRTHRAFELLRRHSPAEANVDFAARLCRRYVPKLGLCFAT